MKKYILLIVASIITATSFSQTEYKDLYYRALNATYIFEGKVIKSTPYYTVDTKHIYTSNTIQITKILKGDLTCGTVEVITYGGEVNGDKLESSHRLRLGKREAGIFMCDLTQKELSVTDYFPESNLQKLQGAFEEQSLIKYFADGERLKAADYNYNVDSLALIYGVYDLFTQINFIDCNNNAILFDGGGNGKQKKIEAPMPTYSRAEYDRLHQASLDLIHQFGKPKEASRANKTLTYTFSNPIITGATTKYFEFDINLADDDGTGYLFAGLARVQYPTSLFGPSVVMNSKIQVTRGPVIADVVTYEDPTPGDVATDVVAIPFTTYPYSSNKYLLSTTPIAAVHVKMELTNCSSIDQVNFIDQISMEAFSYYSPTPNDSFGTPYDAIDATNTQNIPDCHIKITSFDPIQINGGTGQVLSIHGQQFGDSIRNGRIMFPNADDGGNSKIALEQFDYLYWSDTFIQVYIPSIDTGLDVLGNTISYATIGSGKFRVINNDLDSADSDDPLTVYYSLTQLRTPVGAKARVNLINTNQTGGYRFHVDTAIANHPDRIACVRSALRDWSCITGVNWQIYTDTIPWTNDGALDGINMIQFGTGLDTTFLAETQNFSTSCGNTKGIMKEIDVVINKNKPWSYDTTGASLNAGERDLYATLLHEFGHSHSLRHIIDPTKIMHYAGTAPGASAAQRKIHLYADFPASDGGIDVMTVSKNATYASCPAAAIIEYSAPLCEIPNGLENSIWAKELLLKVYPNPFTDQINLQFVTTNISDLQISITNTLGQIIYNEQEEVSSGSHIKSINVENQSTGIYFVRISVNKKSLTAKLVRY